MFGRQDQSQADIFMGILDRAEASKAERTEDHQQQEKGKTTEELLAELRQTSITHEVWAIEGDEEYVVRRSVSRTTAEKAMADEIHFHAAGRRFEIREVS